MNIKNCSCGKHLTTENTTFRGLQKGISKDLLLFNHIDKACGTTATVRVPKIVSRIAWLFFKALYYFKKQSSIKWNHGVFINNSNKHMSYKVAYSYTDNGERVQIDEYFYQTPLILHWVPVPLYRLVQNDPDHVRSIFAELHKVLKSDSSHRECA